MEENTTDKTSRPIKLPKVCFIFALISVGIILLNFIIVLIEKQFGADNFFLNLIRPFAEIATFCFFPIILIFIFIGGFVSFFDLLQAKEKNRKPYFYALTSVVIGLAGFIIFIAGYLYFTAKAWEGGWYEGDSIKGPEGYTYCIMYEDGLMQDPDTKLIRTKDHGNEDIYEDLGIIPDFFSEFYLKSGRIAVIRPARVAEKGETRLFMISDNLLFAVDRNNLMAFTYDIAGQQFYDTVNYEMSPFILIEKADTKLCKPDYVLVILRAIIHRGKYPSQEVLKEGLAHPNKQVRQVSKWLTEIKEHGLADDSDPMSEIIDFLIGNLDSRDLDTQKSAVEALGYFQNSYIDKAIPHLQRIRDKSRYCYETAVESLQKIKSRKKKE